ncbi:nucleotidyl transferase AbiEii/AbiGii toxin family protein (plasmid) [Nocardia sp. CA-084685]|uniref:nucleotidyl transferase AbiEii/AbiGii toxin family protein n=1 Tax=Nocardia sp. CA-084685 TaxID=3239970 RepID=UPI003D986C14
MPQLRKHPNELSALIASTAAAHEIDQLFVEKDFWVTEVLRACFQPFEVTTATGSQPVIVIFKGGTSLSRVFNLIERFSEDVDLLISFPEGGSSIKARDNALKQIRDAVTTHLELPDNAMRPMESTTGVKRNVRYLYPKLLAYSQTEAVVTDTVLLEMGCRGGAFPIETHTLRSMVADHAQREFGDTAQTWEEFAPVTVTVLAAERTMLEKLSMLHDGFARQPEEKAIANLQRGARHLYDIHQLLSSPDVVATLESMGQEQVAALCADIDNHSAAAGFDYTPRPAGGFGHSPLVDPDAAGQLPLRQGFAAAMKLVYGTKPTVDDCLQKIRASAHLL